MTAQAWTVCDLAPGEEPRPISAIHGPADRGVDRECHDEPTELGVVVSSGGSGGGRAMVKFSYCHVPAYPVEESIEIIRTADECGFYAAYSVDETWWKDMWLLFAAAADKTSRIRLGPTLPT